MNDEDVDGGIVYKDSKRHPSKDHRVEHSSKASTRPFDTYMLSRLPRRSE